jgi:hypothetical protein
MTILILEILQLLFLIHIAFLLWRIGDNLFNGK